MKTGRPTPTDGSIESTVYADVESMELNGVSVRLYDCAGQVCYTGLLQMFLTPRAVCLVVCDAGAFGQYDSEAENLLQTDIRTLDQLRVCDWRRSISQRVPQSDVILVATKCDLAGDNVAGLSRRMMSACRAWLASGVNADMKPIRLEDGVCLTSCSVNLSSGNSSQAKLAVFGELWSRWLFGQDETSPPNHTQQPAWDSDWRDNMADKSQQSMLHRVINKENGGGLRGAEMVLPYSWSLALIVLEALEHGRDPVEDVVHRSAKVNRGVESNTASFEGITMEELNARWTAVVVDLLKEGINVTNPDHAMEGALSIREFEGTLVRHETFVFLDVIWLTRILKPLLNHKEHEEHDGSVYLGSTGDTRIKLTDVAHIDSWCRFKQQGILEPDLARIMWPRTFHYVIPTLESLGLTFPLDRGSEEGLVVLLRLEPHRPKVVGEDIDNFRSRHATVLNTRWKFSLGVPPGAIEKVLTRCCSVGAVQTFWRFGVLIQGAIRGSEGGGSFALVLEYSSDSKVLDMKVYGGICTAAPWAALSYAMTAVTTMTTEYPGLCSRASFECPDHGEPIRGTSTVTNKGGPLLQGRGCSRCSVETGGVGAVAAELVRMVDVRQDRDAMFCEVKARLARMQHDYPALLPEESRDVQSETFLSELFKPARGSFLTNLKEDLEVVLGPEGAAATRGPGRQCQDWKNLHLKLDDLLRWFDEDKPDVFGGLEVRIGKLEVTCAKMAELLAADDGVMGRLDVLVAMLMTVRGDKVDTPRNACILPGNYAEPHGLTDELRKPEVWTRTVKEWRQSDFEAGKGMWKKKMRLFLICAHSHELVPCGHNGRGYDIQRVRKWVRMSVDLAKFVLEVACASLATVVVHKLPATTLGDVGEQTVGAASASISGVLGGLTMPADSYEAAEVLRGQVQAVNGNAYESLRRFVHDMEDTARLEISAATRKAHKYRRPPPSSSDFVYFDQVMVKVQPRSGDGEAQWVLDDKAEAWHNATRKAGTR